jgi:hypothetical protein
VGYATGKDLDEVEMLAPGWIASFLDQRRGKDLLIGCGDQRYRPAGDALAAWLQEHYAIRARTIIAGPRASCRMAYQDGFGYTQYGPDPVQADILIGNVQDNALMWKFQSCQGWGGWLPVEVNRDFPGMGHAIVMLSAPVVTQPDGQAGGKQAPQQLVIGGGSPAETMRGVQALEQAFER